MLVTRTGSPQFQVRTQRVCRRGLAEPKIHRFELSGLANWHTGQEQSLCKYMKHITNNLTYFLTVARESVQVGVDMMNRNDIQLQ